MTPMNFKFPFKQVSSYSSHFYHDPDDGDPSQYPSSASDSSFETDSMPYIVKLKLHRLRHIAGLPTDDYSDRNAVIAAHQHGFDVREQIDLLEWYAPDYLHYFLQQVVLINESINDRVIFQNGIPPEEEQKWFLHGYHRHVETFRPIEHIIMSDCLHIIGKEPTTFRSQCEKTNTLQVCSWNDNDPSLHHGENNDSHTFTNGGGHYAPGNHYSSPEIHDLCQPKDDNYSFHHGRQTTVDHYSHPTTNDTHIGGDLSKSMGNNQFECTRNDTSTSMAMSEDSDFIYDENNPDAIKVFVVNYLNRLEDEEAFKLLLDHCPSFRKFLHLEPFTEDELEEIEREGIDINKFLPLRQYLDDNYPTFCVSSSSSSSNSGSCDPSLHHYHDSDARTTLPSEHCDETSTIPQSSQPSDFSSSQRAILPETTHCFGIEYEEEDTVPVSCGESIPTSPLDNNGSAFPLDNNSAKVDASSRMVENTTYSWDGNVCSTTPDASTGDSIMIGCVDPRVPDSFEMEFCRPIFDAITVGNVAVTSLVSTRNSIGIEDGIPTWMELSTMNDAINELCMDMGLLPAFPSTQTNIAMELCRAFSTCTCDTTANIPSLDSCLDEDSDDAFPSDNYDNNFAKVEVVASSTGDVASEGVLPPEFDDILPTLNEIADLMDYGYPSEFDDILSIATNAEDILGVVVICQDRDIAQEKTALSDSDGIPTMDESPVVGAVKSDGNIPTNYIAADDPFTLLTTASDVYDVSYLPENGDNIAPKGALPYEFGILPIASNDDANLLTHDGDNPAPEGASPPDFDSILPIVCNTDVVYLPKYGDNVATDFIPIANDMENILYVVAIDGDTAHAGAEMNNDAVSSSLSDDNVKSSSTTTSTVSDGVIFQSPSTKFGTGPTTSTTTTTKVSALLDPLLLYNDDNNTIGSTHNDINPKTSHSHSLFCLEKHPNTNDLTLLWNFLGQLVSTDIKVVLVPWNSFLDFSGGSLWVPLNAITTETNVRHTITITNPFYIFDPGIVTPRFARWRTTSPRVALLSTNMSSTLVSTNAKLFTSLTSADTKLRTSSTSNNVKLLTSNNVKLDTSWNSANDKLSTSLNLAESKLRTTSTSNDVKLDTLSSSANAKLSSSSTLTNVKFDTFSTSTNVTLSTPCSDAAPEKDIFRYCCFFGTGGATTVSEKDIISTVLREDVGAFFFDNDGCANDGIFITAPVVPSTATTTSTEEHRVLFGHPLLTSDRGTTCFDNILSTKPTSKLSNTTMTITHRDLLGRPSSQVSLLSCPSSTSDYCNTWIDDVSAKNSTRPPILIISINHRELFDDISTDFSIEQPTAMTTIEHSELFGRLSNSILAPEGGRRVLFGHALNTKPTALTVNNDDYFTNVNDERPGITLFCPSSSKNDSGVVCWYTIDAGVDTLNDSFDGNVNPIVVPDCRVAFYTQGELLIDSAFNASYDFEESMDTTCSANATKNETILRRRTNYMGAEVDFLGKVDMEPEGAILRTMVLHFDSSALANNRNNLLYEDIGGMQSIIHFWLNFVISETISHAISTTVFEIFVENVSQAFQSLAWSFLENVAQVPFQCAKADDGMVSLPLINFREGV